MKRRETRKNTISEWFQEHVKSRTHTSRNCTYQDLHWQTFAGQWCEFWVHYLPWFGNFTDKQVLAYSRVLSDGCDFDNFISCNNFLGRASESCVVHHLFWIGLSFFLQMNHYVYHVGPTLYSQRTREFDLKTRLETNLNLNKFIDWQDGKERNYKNFSLSKLNVYQNNILGINMHMDNGSKSRNVGVW